MNISFRQLKAFVAVARLGNLGAAADQLCLTRGAISQALKELETQLGTPLFDRAHPHLLLNSEGALLLPLADEMLTRLDDIGALFAHSGDSAGKALLRIGASQTIGNYLLPGLLARLGPQWQLSVFIANSQQLAERLLAFELDLALIEGEVTHPQLHSEAWQQDQMVLVASPAHPLALSITATAKVLSAGDLAGQYWVLREPASGSREQFDKYLRPQLTNPGTVLELNTLEAVLNTVQQGLGITLVSELAARDRLASGALVVLPFKQPMPRQLHLCWHRDKYLSAASQRFIRFCRLGD
ncbi:LysR family transcriptional regulator [Rheinheimera texasensis]|uniref:LysR family transcriptional regulator n=1 Tax=Rheinheimera texasensis TaxID=306205 RepID=UPI0004E0F4F4|nr:LysR family transcriptional regulator [Rheinheimera texasensis]